MARPITFRIWFDGTIVAEPTIEASTIKIGTASTAHVRLDHPSVSRVHCVIDVGAELEIMDLGSRTGTFVNSAPITRAGIASGDQLRIGDYVLDVIAAAPTNLLGSPVRAKATQPLEPAPSSPAFSPPLLFDVRNRSGAELPAPPAANVVLPSQPIALPRASTAELQESDLIELGQEPDPLNRR